MRERLLRRGLAAAVGLAVLTAGACTGASTHTDSTQTDAAGATPAGSITVFATASLTESFTELVEAFAIAVPEVTVVANFAASSELARQILEGAPADVYASADEVNMQRVVDAGETASDPTTFATNRLQIIVEPGNPLGITGLADLADPNVVFITTTPEVPIGRYTAEVLAAAGVRVTPRSLEESVRGVVNKVVLGEADAGIVYETDVLSVGDRAMGIPIPDASNVVARYPIAVTAASDNPVAARAFIDFVSSEAGRSILTEFGFGAP